MIKPLYKAVEPFMEVKRGYGYQGVLMWDEQSDKVQCHICGGFFTLLANHINKDHSITADEYKIEYGFTLRTALCSKKYSEIRRKISFQNMDKMKRGFKNLRLKGIKHRSLKVHYRKSMIFKNKLGLCDEQMKARYQVVKKIVGHEPSSCDLEKYDSKLYGVIKRRGSLNDWKAKNGYNIVPKSIYWKSNQLVLIAALRRWRSETGSIPKTSDFIHAQKGYPGLKAIYGHFGSWRNALRISGLK